MYGVWLVAKLGGGAKADKIRTIFVRCGGALAARGALALTLAVWPEPLLATPLSALACALLLPQALSRSNDVVHKDLRA